MTTIILPTISIQTKPYRAEVEKDALAQGLDPVLARVIAARPISAEIPLLAALFPKLKNLSCPSKMKNITQAAERVAKAIIEKEYIGIETDHDCDGQTSHAVIFDCLVNHFKHPKEKIRSYIGHRLTEGYGLSDSVAERIIQDLPQVQLVITADNGSSDEPRIKKLKACGIDVIVTDHHEIPKEGLPMSAFTALNPTNPDCGYGDPYIAGCMVAWLLMASTRQVLISQHYLPTNTPTLANCLDFVAVGTIADCVSLARSVNNRAVVTYGLTLIEKGTRPCWRVFKATHEGTISSEDLGFKIGPLLNSDGRLSNAFGSVHFLLAESEDEANAWLWTLQDSNTLRKSIQQDIILKSLVDAKHQVDQGKSSICIYLEDGHSGVHGIAASRIKDLFGRPTVFFSPKVSSPHLITGSVRGIEGFHVRKALQEVATKQEQMIIAFGGHQAAGGLTIALSVLVEFSKAFENAVCLQLAERKLGPVVWTDGPLALDKITLNLVETLSQLEPFGREFEQPVFEIEGVLKSIQYVGDGTHARIGLEVDGKLLSGIWFKMRQSKKDVTALKIKDFVKAAFSVKANFFRGQRRLEIYIIHLEGLGSAK
jgi:single-stranded-DNA-specific exonuclease